jgi:hypothetical protein
VTDSLGPEQRALFESAAGRLHEQIAARGSVAPDDPLLAEQEEALALLQRLGLVQHAGDGGWTAVDPLSVLGSVVAPLSAQAARLLEESSRWAGAFATLAQEYRRTPSVSDDALTELHGPAIEPFLVDAVNGARSELLTAQPQTGRKAAALEAALERDVPALQRGVRLRTIYQHAARRGTPTRRYVARVTAEGAEVRTLDEFFNRMIVIDREVALIPSPEDFSVALVIRDSRIVAYLVDIFERSWERAHPFVSDDSETLSSIAEEQRAMAVRMLLEGHSDAACAKRMGVSQRTYAAYVAELKREYDDAETRFQLGYRMGLEAARREQRPEAGAQ